MSPSLPSLPSCWQSDGRAQLGDTPALSLSTASWKCIPPSSSSNTLCYNQPSFDARSTSNKHNGPLIEQCSRLEHSNTHLSNTILKLWTFPVHQTSHHGVESSHEDHWQEASRGMSNILYSLNQRLISLSSSLPRPNLLLTLQHHQRHGSPPSTIQSSLLDCIPYWSSSATLSYLQYRNSGLPVFQSYSVEPDSSLSSERARN